MEILIYSRMRRSVRQGCVMGGAAVLGVVVAAGYSLHAGPQAQPVDEYQVKAAFLYNFAKFVQWPAGTFQSASEPLAICVLGQDPFGRALQDTVDGRAIDGRPLVIRHISSLKQYTGCHELFIGAAEYKRSLPMFADIKTPGILTIGDTDAVVGDGVVINFKLEGAKVRFAINVEAAERGKLRISSRLLSLAQIVEAKSK